MAYGPPPQPGPGPWQQPPQQQQWQQPHQQAPQQWQQPPQQQGWQQPPPQQQGRQPQPPPPVDQGPADAHELNWALMAYIGQFVIGALAPAIVYFGRIRSPFVRRHAAQGLNMGVAGAVVWIVGLLLSQLIGILVWIPVLFTVALFVFLVYAGRAANKGEFRRVPAVLAWPLLK
ncbi:hypothetical protein BTM25_29690 [Actinomadura rubteroloni]|uniref:DUF4870 domain-containing protein n=1 Tax=Actinomadura rubteroloni TaxID=1926885 RepID=A0A2P4UH24_9ACTN|nr:DUF4870 domain-containing protein [Actinomadura rubteroloni]POM24340.1 hypothetical protein BTM25_29690 [Actinomadura rubteroloni]